MTDIQHDYNAFLGSYPGYAKTADALDAMRTSEYSRFERLGHTYLDYTGGGQYADSQIERHLEVLRGDVFGNPHSHNPTSLAATAHVERAREAVLRYFNASPEEYDVVFTQNASGALKLVGESYPFRDGSTYLLSYDNHNSVNGIREFARCRGCSVNYVPVEASELRLDADTVRRELRRPAGSDGAARLFAYPAQSNFSGVQHPLEWIAEARSLGWDVVLDAAAFAPTNRIDLSVVQPDFMPVSFYKMFGYPTGIGALIARHEALAKLARPWFAGGTITLASVQAEGWYHLAPGHTGFEDGTVDYLGLPAVTIGLEHLEAVGIDVVHERVSALADWLLAHMREARHSNHAPLFRVFGPDSMDRRGATIAFYLLDPAGEVFDVGTVEAMAGRQLISVRSGCFCNPGDGEVAHGITRDEMAGCFAEPAQAVTLSQCQDLIRDHTGKVPNTLRVSLGIASNFEDVWRFARFAQTFRDREASGLKV